MPIFLFRTFVRKRVRVSYIFANRVRKSFLQRGWELVQRFICEMEIWGRSRDFRLIRFLCFQQAFNCRPAWLCRFSVTLPRGFITFEYTFISAYFDTVYFIVKSNEPQFSNVYLVSKATREEIFSDFILPLSRSLSYFSVICRDTFLSQSSWSFQPHTRRFLREKAHSVQCAHASNVMENHVGRRKSPT